MSGNSADGIQALLAAETEAQRIVTTARAGTPPPSPEHASCRESRKKGLVCQADKSAVSVGGEDQGAEEVTVHGA